MAQEALVILVYLIIDESLLAHQLAIHALLEAIHYLVQDRLIEHHLLAAHAASHIATSQQLATLQDDAIATGIKHIHPELLIQYLAREDEHLHLRILLLGLATYLHPHCSGTAQSQVQEHQVGQLLLDEFPIGYLVFGCTYNLSLRNVVLEDALSALSSNGTSSTMITLKFSMTYIYNL